MYYIMGRSCVIKPLRFQFEDEIEDKLHLYNTYSWMVEMRWRIFRKEDSLHKNLEEYPCGGQEVNSSNNGEFVAYIQCHCYNNIFF